MPAGIIAGIAGLGGLAVNAWNAYQQWKNTEYLKKQQVEAWRREDTAQQRAVADLRAAGLSPTLAAGHGAPVSSPVRTEAPQMKLTPAEIAGQALSLMKMKADISRTNAEARVSNVQATVAEQTVENQILMQKYAVEKLYEERMISQTEADYRQRVLDQKLRNLRAQEQSMILGSEIKKYDYDISRKLNVRTSDHNQYLQWALAGAGVLEDLRDKAQEFFDGR